jgi:predicted Na+-dependent transporter
MIIGGSTAGLAIFCCVPTTLTSGVSLTQLAGANTALALALTVTSNLLGIFTMPYMLSALVGHGSGVSLPAGPLLKALVEILLIPLLIGKVRDPHSTTTCWIDAVYLCFISFSWQLLNYSAWEKLYFLSSLLQLHSKVIALSAEVWTMEGLVGAVHTWDFQ